jgi:SAM-dependent methyltransferase
LIPGNEAWSCAACGRRFRALRGIPDLRTSEDAYLANADDWAIAEQLELEFDRTDFRGLLDRYFAQFPETPPDLQQRQIAHILTAPGRSRQWLSATGADAVAGPLLDLGCGTGSFLAALGNAADASCGLDIAMRWLIVARKRLDEEGLRDIPLVCGCAERLPFESSTFARIIAGDVIEHVADQPATLRETHRVLQPRGRLFLASPNRYSIAPEPHVQVWGVGYLPRTWMRSYVRLVRGVEFKAIRTLGVGEWRQLLKRSPFGNGRISCPPLPSGDFAHFSPLKRILGRAYNLGVMSRLGQALARRIGPLFHVVCERTDALGPQSIRPTHPHSRPTTAPA